MIRTVAAATLALLGIIAPAHAMFVDPTYAPEVLDLDLTYPGGTTLTGDLGIGLGGPGFAAYYGGVGPGLSVNGTPLTFLTSYPGTLYAVVTGTDHIAGISFPVLAFSDPNYGNPLNLTPSEIYFNNIIASSGTVACTAECNDAVNPVPLPGAFPLFGSALAGLGGFGWWKKRREGFCKE